jgi:hypothetical protein
MDKDTELYALKPDGKNTWRIVNEDNIFIVDIHDYDIEEMCENIRNKDYIEKYSAEEFIERIWEDLRDEFSPQVSNCVFCDNWDRFCAWCDNQIMEYFITELSNIYKSRLLDFE